MDKMLINLLNHDDEDVRYACLELARLIRRGCELSSLARQSYRVTTYDGIATCVIGAACLALSQDVGINVFKKFVGVGIDSVSPVDMLGEVISAAIGGHASQLYVDMHLGTHTIQNYSLGHCIATISDLAYEPNFDMRLKIADMIEALANNGSAELDLHMDNDTYETLIVIIADFSG